MFRLGVLSAAVGTSLAASAKNVVESVDACNDGVFCNGLSVLLTNGECAPLFPPCDDLDSDTIDTCDEASKRCFHALKPGVTQQCVSNCDPDCSGKECGEDGCGGFCGECSLGLGCSENKCVSGAQSGSCGAPFEIDITEATAGAGQRTTFRVRGDTSKSVHMLTPTCNTLTAAPEVIYRFTIPEGKSFGYDIRTPGAPKDETVDPPGYDTVLQIMKDSCSSEAVVGCADDATPPGNLGSRVSGLAGPGEYYVLVDGYSSVDFGEFELQLLLVPECQPLCDGNFCGPDGCGGTCGVCNDGSKCGSDNRCYPDPCTPQCTGRQCGEDGCGGDCGICETGLVCQGEALLGADEEQLASSVCAELPVCDHAQPTCNGAVGLGCLPEEFCGTDCNCHKSLADLPDMIVDYDDLLNECFLHDVNVPETSCALLEGCVALPGMRRLLRFTSSGVNQGRSDFAPPSPKANPQFEGLLYEFGRCHQHYHYKNFATYTLFQPDGQTVSLAGKKYAYCMEDTVQALPGPNTVKCEKQYDCGGQGIQHGWKDSYGWSLDCSWIDVTDLAPGDYVLEVAVNPIRQFQETSFDNNLAKINVNIPAAELGSLLVAEKLQTSVFDECLNTCGADTKCEGAICVAQCTVTASCCQAGTACTDSSVTGCVCGFDPYCCDMEFDAQCVSEAMDRCGLAC